MRLIDADALKAYIDAQKGRPWIGCTIGEALKIMTDEQPTIEPERKTGEWINCDGLEHWKCDKCGCRAGYWFNEENSSSWELDMSEWLSDFCPNCGAKME